MKKLIIIFMITSVFIAPALASEYHSNKFHFQGMQKPETSEIISNPKLLSKMDNLLLRRQPIYSIITLIIWSRVSSLSL
jgi:hypothetical protein